MTVPSLLFNTVRVQENPDPSTVKTLPAGEYVCVCYSKDNAADQVLKINRYCARNRLKPTLVLHVELLNDVFSTDSTTVKLELLVREIPPVGSGDELIIVSTPSTGTSSRQENYADDAR